MKAIDIERKNRLLKVCYAPTANSTFLAFFLAVAINSSSEANKAGLYVLLSSLYYLDVNGEGSVHLTSLSDSAHIH